MRDAPQIGKREVLVVGDGVRERVGVDVREPEDDDGDGHEAGDVPRFVFECLGPRDDDCEDEDRPVDEASEPLAPAARS